MSHRNNDNNGPWNNRNSRNNNNDGGDGVGRGGGGGGNYKDRNWGGNNRYGPDNRYNNKERRNYRGYGGGGRRNYDGRPYRNNTWINNGMQDGNYTRYQNNWHQKHPGNKLGVLGTESDAMQQQIPPLMINFDVESGDQQQRVEVVSSGNAAGGADRDSANGSSMDKETESNKSWMNDDFGSPGDGFQGFADVDFVKTSNGGSSNDCMNFASKLSSEKDDKSDISLQENELSKLIVDEAMKIISDAEQPSCSSASQSNPSDASAPTAASTASNPNPERRASIERSAEQVTRKLINQLTSMNKHSLKQVINNPDSKYETALKTHARQKLRAEVRRQLRNFNLNESTAQPKTACSMLEPDESVDSDKIPDALLEQIGKVLDLNLLDLNVTEEPVPVPTVGEEDECVTNPSDADYSATEVLDKNLRLTDEDGQFDTDDLFARAEQLLMKGSESVRKGNSSGPSSPTDEMFPNEQIDSIVSEDNGMDLNESESDQIERMLDEPLHAAFPCFLRVSTVEELNKKVDTLPVPMEESESCTVETAVPLLPPPELMDDSSISNLPGDDVQVPLAPVSPEEQCTPSFEITAETDFISLVEDSSLPSKEEPVQDQPEKAIDLEAIPVTVPDESVEELTKQESIPIASPSKNPTSEPSPGTIRAPTHPELATRKSKGSKTYKPNLVQHEHSKRDSSSKSSSASPSQTASSSSHVSSVANSKAASKSGTATNLNNVSKQTKYQNNNNNNNPTSNNNNSNSSNTRGRSRGRRDTAGSNGSKDNTVQPNGTSASSENHIKNSNNGSLPTLAAAVAITGNDSRPPSQQPVEQSAQRSIRSKTPGPSLAGGPQDHSSPLGVKKKKKRNRRKDRSPPPDSGMMLECDLRVSRPAVTPTPPPVQTRDTPQIKKSTEPDRSSSTKPSREMRAKSADPKLYYESKKDRDRNRDRGRNRDEDKKSKSKEDKKDQEREDRKEVRREKEGEAANGSASSVVEVSKTELSVSKPDHRSERKKSPVPKPAVKLPVDTPKHSKESKDEPKEIPKETVQEREKETPKQIAKECTREATKEPKVKEKEDKDVPKDNGPKHVPDCKEESDGLGDLPKEKDLSDVPDGPSKPAKPHKKKKSLLRGPNLIKGRREVVEQSEPQVQSQQKDSDEVEILEIPPPPSESNEPVTTPSHSYTRQREAPVVALTQSAPTLTVPIEHHTLMATSAASLIQRTASPRPWKSPGEKKLIPPSITAIITHPMSPPPVERARKIPTPTPSSPVMSPEPPQRIHLVASPIIMSQPEVLTGRMSLQSTLAPLATATAAPQINTFAPVMVLLNQMQDIDSKMSEFQRRKMQIDSEMMRLNSEKFQIDQSSMQLQNERFMLLNSLRAALVECELTTLASMQSVSHMPAATTSPTVSHRRRNPEPELETAPKSKRRKEALEVISRPVSTVVSSLSTDLSESEEPATPVTGGERTIRRITKISGNTEILKLFQRRRLISDRSAEESQSEDNSTPQVVSTPTAATAATVSVSASVERPTPAKRRRTRTYGGSVGGGDQNESSITGARLRSDSTKSVESVKAIETSDHPTGPTAGMTSRFKKDEEIPLVVAHRRLLPREVKVVLNKLNVAAKRGCDGT
ncbi:uncharacterized protein DDB_G0284459-like isoform X2 [Ochlerotatus camptorhynchus]|uniref:uncharacterized protein DDB_G0284459-like isoform X2 n=1 Tax=Ochlerotatus camptorhynchus TaxID=644619 RepID=UPI0031D65A34